MYTKFMKSKLPKTSPNLIKKNPPHDFITMILALPFFLFFCRLLDSCQIDLDINFVVKDTNIYVCF